MNTRILLLCILILPFASALEGYESPRNGFSADSSVRVLDTAIYNTGYVSEDGSDWQPFSLTGTTRGNWIVGEATSNIDISSARYVAIFSCNWNQGWSCGSTWQVLDRGEQQSQNSSDTPNDRNSEYVSLDSQQGDEIALKALYDSTNGDDWTNNDGWNNGNVDLSNPPVHVVTEQINGEWRVRQINLHNSGGNVATNVDHWEGAQYLGGNNLAGTFPQEMSNLKKLTHLRVKENKMTGTIDHFVQDLESAVRLSFSNANYAPSRKEFLYAPGENNDFAAYNHAGKGQWSTNQFSGTIPNLDMLSNLELFELSHGSITGSLPEKLPSSIRVLAVQENKMTGTLPTWENCVNFTHLYLRQQENSGSYTGSIPAEWNNFAEMRWFSITGNDLTGSIPYLGSWYDLRQFNVGANPGMSGEFPDWLWTEESKRQRLHTSSIGGGYLGGSEITGGLPQNTTKVSGRTAVFRFAGTNIGGPIPLWMFEQNSQQYGMYNSNFTSMPPNAFEYIDRAKILRFNNNNIQGQLPTGPIPPNVLRFYFSDNAFSGTIPAHTWALEQYVHTGRDFNLHDNLLEGKIPIEFAYAGSVGGGQIRNLRLYNNKFTPADILPNYQAIATSLSGEYMVLPQKPFGEVQSATVGDILDYSEHEYSGNIYQWSKDSVEIPGATGPSIDTSSYGSGEYVLEIVHPDIDFTFISQPITVE